MMMSCVYPWPLELVAGKNIHLLILLRVTVATCQDALLLASNSDHSAPPGRSWWILAHPGPPPRCLRNLHRDVSSQCAPPEAPSQATEQLSLCGELKTASVSMIKSFSFGHYSHPGLVESIASALVGNTLKQKVHYNHYCLGIPLTPLVKHSVQ